MRRTRRLAVAVVLSTTTLTAGAGAGTVAHAVSVAPAPKPRHAKALAPADLARKLGLQTTAKHDTVRPVRKGVASANPLLSLTEDPSRTDLAAWRQKLAERATARVRQAGRDTAAPTAQAPLAVTETEPAAVRGRDDSTSSAQVVPGFGLRRNPAALITGTLAAPPVPTTFTPRKEDDGSISLASPVGLTPGTQRKTSGVIGDGPHGSKSAKPTGDFDFYSIKGAKAGQRLRVDVDTAAESELDSLLVLWDSAGNALAANDDDAEGPDSLLAVTLPKDGDYYVSMVGFGSLPGDPFDSGSGEGAALEGAYQITFGLDANDRDVYAVDLAAGDVLSGSVDGAGTTLDVTDPAGTLVMGSSQDSTAIYPIRSPLAGGGNAVVDHVVSKSGRYYLGVEGNAGTYGLTVEVHRSRHAVQTIFLDFDGARLNTAAFGGPGVRTLSPLSSYLAGWGLTPAQEPALIDRITRTVSENLQRDNALSGVRVRVVDSRHSPDTFGRSNVSRVILGGSVDQAGVDTIGISQSIDPGNFDTAETALVLLDTVSSTPADGGDASFNTYLKPTSDKIAFIGTALGNIASHEAGHFLGNWHVDQFDADANLMDQGGNFPLLYAVGADGVGGTADDPDVDFGVDAFNPDEGFTGLEDTSARTRFGLGAFR